MAEVLLQDRLTALLWTTTVGNYEYVRSCVRIFFGIGLDMKRDETERKIGRRQGERLSKRDTETASIYSLD